MAPQFNARAATGTTDMLSATPLATGCISPVAADLFGPFGQLRICRSRLDRAELTTPPLRVFQEYAIPVASVRLARYSMSDDNRHHAYYDAASHVASSLSRTLQT